MKKLVCLLITIFVLSGTIVVCEELGALKIYKSVLPIYHKKTLQFMIFCDEMTRQADKIYATGAIINLMKKNVDIDKIKYLGSVKVYKLGTGPPEVAEFWKDKTSSNGFIASSKATILQESKVASGGEKVFFRSPQLDLNGVGFTANFNTRIIKVLHDVNIIIRMKADKKNKNSSGKDAIVKVKANSMILNMEKELVTLIGNIEINDVNFDIFCDRLLLDLKKNKKQKDSGGALDPSGVSQISCFGNVRIIRKVSAAELKKNGAQKAFADKAVYDTVRERITLYGKNPRIYRGNDMISGDKIVLWKDSERLQAFKNCLVEIVLPNRDKTAKAAKQTQISSDFIDFDYANNLGIFTGNVRVKNADLRLNCNKMTIYLESRGKKKDIVDSLIAASGKKNLKEIVCVGNVIIRRDNKASGKNEKALAGRAVYILRENKIILSENNPFIISGRDSISGKRMIVWLDQNRLKVIKNSKIILGEKENIKLQSTAINKTTVLSDSSDLNYGSNELSFSGKVKIENPQMNLICDNMKIFLDEQKTVKKSVKSSDSLGELDRGGKKDVNKVICVGAVRVDSPRARVNCDRMVITFKDRVPGDKKSNIGIGGGSNREVDLIKCFGNVYMVNKPEDPTVEPTVITSNDAILNIPANVADLIANVKITESRFDLTCEKMKIFAKDITPAQAAANAAENKDNIDMLPEHIGIGETKELSRIICLDKVVMTRKLPDEIQKARGDKAVYEVSKHNITLTGIKNKPTLQRGVTVMEGEKIILWTDSERLDIKEGTLKNFDPRGL